MNLPESEILAMAKAHGVNGQVCSLVSFVQALERRAVWEPCNHWPGQTACAYCNLGKAEPTEEQILALLSEHTTFDLQMPFSEGIVESNCGCRMYASRFVDFARALLGVAPKADTTPDRKPIDGGPQLLAWNDPRGGWVLDTVEQATCAHKRSTWGNDIHVCNDCKKVLG